MPSSVAQQLVQTLQALFPSSTWGRALALLVLFNAQSFPLVWHVEVMAPYFAWLARSRWLGKIDQPPALRDSDPHKHNRVQQFRAWPAFCDVFGFHLSNSSYAAFADHLRGPFIYGLLATFFDVPTTTFALGSTTFDFRREIPLLRQYKVTMEVLGYDKKWLYLLARYTSVDAKGAVQTHCLHLSHVVLKINGRRTVQPARAFALSGFGEHGKQNLAIVDKMSKRERADWLIEKEGAPKRDIVVGPIEFGMQSKSEWPGQLQA